MSAALLCALFFSMLAEAAPPAGTRFRVRDDDGNRRVEILAASEAVAESPPEGLWSIACDWRDGWPADWMSAAPNSVSTSAEWTILKGELKACGGKWALEDAYRTEGRVVKGVRRFSWLGPGTSPKVTLSVRFRARTQKAKALLPGILYYGNPSGARSGKVPVWSAAPGDDAFYEEHRYPMPFAYLELEDQSKFRGLALHSVPSPVPYGNLQDQWWSLGVSGRAGSVEAGLLSGPCASNGRHSVIKAYQKTFAPYDSAWLRVPAGAIIEKSFYIEAFPVDAEGQGFARPVHTSLELFAPFSLDGLPGFEEIIRAKYRYAKTRWHDGGTYGGFRKYQDRDGIAMGWTGQAEALGYALQILGPGLGDPESQAMVQRSLDFLSSAEFYAGGFHNWFEIQTGKWTHQELLSQGQAMLAFARAIQAGRRNRRDTSKWEAFLRKASDVHSRRILGDGWKPISTNDATFIAPMVLAFQLFGTEDYRKAALKGAEHYAARHLTMREPYWGGTLDAESEDKEGAAAAFQGFLALYEMTQDPEHLRWAQHACDVALTYTVVWDIDLPPGRMRDHNFRTRGWTAVSPQNQHLDVWGVILAPDIYRLGELVKDEDLKKLALVMYRSCGQLIDAYGSQGEQMQQTNYMQGTGNSELTKLRGGYNEQWTVFWITAHFLTGAARFQELGVPVWGR